MMDVMEKLLMSTKRMLKQSNIYIYRTIAGESLLIPVFGEGVSMDALYSLNKVGTFIWKALEKPILIEDLIRLVAGEFDGDIETIVSDVSEFLASLEEIGAIQEVVE